MSDIFFFDKFLVVLFRFLGRFECADMKEEVDEEVSCAKERGGVKSLFCKVAVEG